ncbi:hypothetical protein [Pedobacter sp. R20-19]|uniref:hypothetical protein n=1 Tax=Pedobacter sp. R20-19 TaxID=1270196 RepID=UPI000493A183|nr:hypothetical protein [Pedobacter sp. R20-19]
MGSIEYNERFSEFERLRKSSGYHKRDIIIENATFEILDKWIKSPELFDFFTSCDVSGSYMMDRDGNKMVDKVFSQLMLIERLVDGGLATNSLSSLGASVKKAAEKYKPLLYWNESGMVIAYLDKMGIKNWARFIEDVEMEWNSFNALQKAFSVLEVNFEDVLNYLRKLHSATGLAGAVHQASRTLIEKLSIQPALADKFDTELEVLIGEKYTEDFMTAIIIGLVDKKTENFDLLLDRLKDQFGNEKLYLLLWAFGRCCPDERRTNFKGLIEAKFDAGKLNKGQYLRLCGMCKFVGDELCALAKEPMKSGDFEGVFDYVYDLIALEHNQEWFRLASIQLFTVDEPSFLGQLNLFLYSLCEHNLDLVYELLTKRFESMGEHQLLDSNLDHIIDLDHDRFHVNLTKWFNSENRNVHKAMLRICSGRNSSAVFKVSKIYFETLSAEEKVYICIKIAGFVYSMEQLQSLLFSVLDAALPDDEALLTNLQGIFVDYLVYNYRSTLDMIKDRLKDTKCPIHQRDFLQPIDDDYENYFKNLNKVRVFKELQSDSMLEEFTRFYKNQLFAASMKESNTKGFLSMMKSVNLYAKKWAIRRKEEKVHEVAELALIQHSFEFPSGEKLDPTRQETLRRNYQRIQKHEINFS